MLNKVQSVIANNDYSVTVSFDDGQTKRYDVRPLLNEGVFQMLREPAYFHRVQVIHGFGGIEWPDGQDIAPEELEKNGVPVFSREAVTV